MLATNVFRIFPRFLMPAVRNDPLCSARSIGSFGKFLPSYSTNRFGISDIACDVLTRAVWVLGIEPYGKQDNASLYNPHFSCGSLGDALLFAGFGTNRRAKFAISAFAG
jgi:hypothetical protein